MSNKHLIGIKLTFSDVLLLTICKMMFAMKRKDHTLVISLTGGGERVIVCETAYFYPSEQSKDNIFLPNEYMVENFPLS